MLLKKIRETIVSSYNARVLETELLKKKIRGLPPAAVYRHYNNLREKLTSTINVWILPKSYKTKLWVSEFARLLIQEDFKDLTTLSSEMCKAGFQASKEEIRTYLKSQGYWSKSKR